MSAFGQYARIWRVPGAPLLLTGGVIARLGQGVTVLAWLLLVQETTGSFGQAGLVGASISLATAATAPVAGRLADKHGAGRVLPFYALAYAALQLALLWAVLGRAPLVVLCVMAALSGAVFPAITPALRAAWTVLTSEESGRSEVRTAAMAAESTLFELVFVIGPLIFSGFMLIGGPLGDLFSTRAAIAGPACALAAAALCTGLGTLALSRGRALRALLPSPDASAATRGLGPLKEPGVLALLSCAAGIAFSFGGAPVAIAAFAKQHEGAAAEGVTGVLIAVWSIGSALAGFWYGSRTFKAPLVRQFTGLLVGLSAGYALWTLMPGSLALGVLLFVSGAVIAPALTVEAELVGALVPERMLNEAYTWLTTTNLSMAALGSAVTGALVEGRDGPTYGFLAAAAATAIAAAVAAWPGLLTPRRQDVAHGEATVPRREVEQSGS
ncbi:MFS transporter [Streptomyces azureus]|uniref:Major facilitator superfamily MFS_1 n=1 Tax=Streptomyces azureus TaxID=146537 RepID=A0A0K8PFU9_STRAJ|nr:MFS transporter [Streptomyces azureus]GAP46274.1 major facilitator superfamily MFS_1 [Streptomyces azureus]